jgi:hypothetical protein
MAVAVKKQKADTETLRAEAQAALQTIDAKIASKKGHHVAVLYDY